MIGRKGFWILILLWLAMTAAAVWRLSLLPDWTQMPVPTPKGVVTMSGLVLFIEPLGLLFVIAVLAAQNWLVSGPTEALMVWYRRTGLLPITVGVCTALMQAFIISHSLGEGLNLNGFAIARTLMVVVGILMILYGNVVPKLPRLSKRLAILNLDPWQQNQHSRFAGKLAVAAGLLIVFLGFALPLLPPKALLPLTLGPPLAVVAANLWYRVKLKREPSQRS